MGRGAGPLGVLPTVQPGLNSQEYFREERGLEGIRVSSVWFWACYGPQACCRAF